MEFSNSQSSMAEPAKLSNKISEGFIGYLDVFIHQARGIYNICIYHKQDVYAKLCLTTDPEAAVSTQIINCAGRNPVFNENIRLNVRTLDSSLRCEIWMLSRVKNYLGDQLLGLSLVPLPDVVVASGNKLALEYSLSSTDLFHSPAGFVQLSLSYVGSLPAVPMVPAKAMPDLENENEDSIPTVYEKIEFPDLKVDNENQLMVSEYFRIPCARMDTQCSQSLITMENDSCPDDNDDAGVHVVDCLSKDNGIDAVEGLGNETPLSSAPITDTPVAASPGQTDKSPVVTESVVIKPVVGVDTIKSEEIVDMYMKSMQQFTESLAKMKLPMDSENGYTATENVNSSSQKKLRLSKESSPRIFYGSRAFF
ncbi:uncharacterized protein [Typha angustifolia]|uniref:uncharacterized protein n=1 Tax=Typha angustifolia TaxID=59011 RepID=UPI003C2B5B77